MMGMCHDAVPKLEPTLALVCFILNIIFPGVGTMIGACMGEKFNPTTLVFGLLQFFFCWLICPWIWSIIFGWWMYKKANGKN